MEMEKERLEKMVYECTRYANFRKKDINGTTYCILLFPEETNKMCECRYCENVVEFEFRNSFGLRYTMPYHRCMLETEAEKKKKR